MDFARRSRGCHIHARRKGAELSLMLSNYMCIQRSKSRECDSKMAAITLDFITPRGLNILKLPVGLAVPTRLHYHKEKNWWDDFLLSNPY